MHFQIFPDGEPMHFNWRKLRDPSQEKADNRAWRAELTVLAQVDEELREDGRRVCKNNLLALCYVLGYCLITEEVHKEAIEFFPEIDPNKTVEELAVGIKRRGTLMYPRNTYKSTLDLANCIRLILHYYMTIAILIISGAKDLSFDFVDQISSFFYCHPKRPPTLFQVLFPELCVDKEPQRGVFTAALRQHEPKILEPLIWGNSLASSTTGWHPDVAIYDDIHNNRNSKTFEARSHITKDYKLTRKILKPTGFELMIGTPYGAGDVFSDQVLTAKPHTYTRIYKPAMRLKSGERLDPNGFPNENELELLFPTILSYDFLREEYEGDYDSFMSQYMLDSYGAAEIVFPEAQMLDAMITEENVPMEGETFIHWRLPCKKLGWSTANAAVGIKHRNRMTIAEALQGHYKPSVMAKLIVDTARKFGTHHISIEDSPGARRMQSTIQNYALTVGWDIYITWLDFQEDSGDRDTRIRNLEADMSMSRLLFSDGISKLKLLIEGFTRYGMMEENGLPDVVSRVADNLPQSIAADGIDNDDSAWEMMRQRDKYNLIYGRGAYARPEPEPEETPYVEPDPNDAEYTDTGLPNILGGLNG
jgi:hypothetical protein